MAPVRRRFGLTPARFLSLGIFLAGNGREGLAGSRDERSLAELERKLARSQGELAATRVRVREAELALAAAREREEQAARTYRAFAARARQVLASCPRCRNRSAAPTSSSAAAARTATRR